MRTWEPPTCWPRPIAGVAASGENVGASSDGPSSRTPMPQPRAERAPSLRVCQGASLPRRRHGSRPGPPRLEQLTCMRIQFDCECCRAEIQVDCPKLSHRRPMADPRQRVRRSPRDAFRSPAVDVRISTVQVAEGLRRTSDEQRCAGRDRPEPAHLLMTPSVRSRHAYRPPARRAPAPRVARFRLRPEPTRRLGLPEAPDFVGGPWRI